MSAVSLESKCSDRLVPSPTKLPTRYPSESTLTSLATLMESRGVGGRSRIKSPRKRPVLAHALMAGGAPTSAVAITSLRSLGPDMAVNVPGPGEKRKGFQMLRYEL